MQSDKIPDIIYADMESLTKKVDGCADNPVKSCQKKMSISLVNIQYQQSG